MLGNSAGDVFGMVSSRDPFLRFSVTSNDWKIGEPPKAGGWNLTHRIPCMLYYIPTFTIRKTTTLNVVL